jgi:hypothetical protein
MSKALMHEMCGCLKWIGELHKMNRGIAIAQISANGRCFGAFLALPERKAVAVFSSSRSDPTTNSLMNEMWDGVS